MKFFDFGEEFSGDFFKLFVEEFSVVEKIVLVIDLNLVEIVKSLFLEKFFKDKLVEV